MTTSESLKPASTSPLGETHDFRDVGGFRGFWVDAGGEDIVVQEGRVGGHGGFDVQHVGEDFVFDLDQVERLFGDELRCRGDGGNGVAVVEDFSLRHAVQREVAEVVRRGADMGALGRNVGEVGSGDDGFDACELPGFCSVLIEMIRAWACGLRLMRPHSMPGRVTSVTPKLARPVTLSTNRRGGSRAGAPTTPERGLVEVVHGGVLPWSGVGPDSGGVGRGGGVPGGFARLRMGFPRLGPDFLSP